MKQTIQEQIAHIEPLSIHLKAAETLEKKLYLVENHPFTKRYLSSSPLLQTWITQVPTMYRFVIQSLLAIGQGEVVFQDIESIEKPQEDLDMLVALLVNMEQFYDFMGGIVGYHLTVLKFIKAIQQQTVMASDDVHYAKPEGVDISQDAPQVRKIVRWGIEHLNEMGEIYPLGGAGDRLDLIDEKSGQPLPAAELRFCGRTLFEGLVRDLQGREFLYYKLFGKQLVTPLGIMTSHEKDNRAHVETIGKTAQWFGRPRETFDLFVQILVPMITIEGDWAMRQPLHPQLKPGGHGALWKTAEMAGVFKRFRQSHHSKVLIRQINNPVAGMDHGLLSLVGIGCHKKKSFGFASCPRLLNTSEGMDVLCERHRDHCYEYCITNIEYTDFKKHGVTDEPDEEGGEYSKFPANTNILFADLESVSAALDRCSLPGLLINMKSEVKCYVGQGCYELKKVARLESTMQNIADFMVDERGDERLKDQEELKTFLTYNKRRKTISVVKQSYHKDQPIIGTPEGGFYELMQNYRDLLMECGMEVPPEQDVGSYLEQGPHFVALFHPAMGVLYSVIAQKIRDGRIASKSELLLEISEAEFVNVDVEGSLIVEADAVMGKRDEAGHIVYDSAQTGKCTLIDVVVRNRGTRFVSLQHVWKREVKREEALTIILHGNGEFFADGVTFTGSHHFEVADGERIMLCMRDGKIVQRSEKIVHATWQWHYAFNEEDRIILTKEG